MTDQSVPGTQPGDPPPERNLTAVPDDPEDIADLADGDELPESELELDQSPNPFPGSPA